MIVKCLVKQSKLVRLALRVDKKVNAANDAGGFISVAFKGMALSKSKQAFNDFSAL